jgi:hypothetical protein
MTEWPEFKNLQRVTALAARCDALMDVANIVHEIAQRPGQGESTVIALAEVMVCITVQHREAVARMRGAGTSPEVASAATFTTPQHPPKEQQHEA